MITLINKFRKTINENIINENNFKNIGYDEMGVLVGNCKLCNSKGVSVREHECPINENIINENFVSNSNITNLEELKSYILSNLPKVFETYIFSKMGDMTILPFTYEIVEPYSGTLKITINSEPYMNDDLGNFKFSMSECIITNWGGELKYEKNDGEFTFKNQVLLNMKLNYKHIGGRSNSADFILPGNNSSSLWYNINENKIVG